MPIAAPPDHELDPRVPGRFRRGLAAVAMAGLAVVGGACSQDTASEGVAPEDADPGPAQQPGGSTDDPTLSGNATDGVGEGNAGGDGSGSPDSGTGPGAGSGDGSAGGDSPTAGQDG
jgi:hypothetical protein